MSTVTDAITRAANELGVPTSLAFAIAKQESGLNPNAVGDGGHSVGLFQLNDRGEGAGMTDAQKRDPYTNARTALSVVANVLRSHPDYSPGQVAAAAQRPADPHRYAISIDAMLNGGGGFSLSDIPDAIGNAASSIPGVDAIGGLIGGGGVPDPFGVVSDTKDAVQNVASAVLNLPETLKGLALFGLFLAGGVTLVVLGAWRSVQSSPTVQNLQQQAPMIAAAAMA